MANEINNEFVFYSEKLNYKTAMGMKGKEYFVEGYISTGDLDLVNDIVTKSCMDSMLSQFDNRTIKMDFEHEAFRGANQIDSEAAKTRIPLGKAITKSQDSKGVMVKWKMNPSWKKFDSKGDVVMTFKDIWTNVEDGMYDAFSIAYVPTRTKSIDREGKSVRLLDDVNLLNVALTGNAINPQATMTAVMAKSLEFMKGVEGEVVNMEQIEIKDSIDKIEAGIQELKHKYIKRTGSSGNYQYTYPEDGKQGHKPGARDSRDAPPQIGGMDAKIHARIDELPEIADEVDNSDLQGITDAITSDILGRPKTKEERQLNSELNDVLLGFARGDNTKKEVAEAIDQAKKVQGGSGNNKEENRKKEANDFYARQDKESQTYRERLKESGKKPGARDSGDVRNVVYEKISEYIDPRMAQHIDEATKEKVAGAIAKRTNISEERAKVFVEDWIAKETTKKPVTKKEHTFIEVLNNREGKKIVEQIEEIGDSKESRLKKIKQNLIKELDDKFGYQYRTKSMEELFKRATELNLTVEMADRFIKSNLSSSNADKENMGCKPMVKTKDEVPEEDAKTPPTPEGEGSEASDAASEGEAGADTPAEGGEAEGKSMTLKELKSVVETLTKDVDALKKENKDLKAIVEKPLQKAKGPEQKSQGQEQPEMVGPLDMV